MFTINQHRTPLINKILFRIELICIKKKSLRQAVGKGRFRTTLHSKDYIYVGGYVSQFCGRGAGRNVQLIAIKFGTKFSLDVNKN